jgi:hypothetical protein
MSVEPSALADELTPTDSLSALLARIVEKQATRDTAAAAVKKMEKEIDELEALASEQLAASGLDGCRAAGRTWWVDEALYVSVLKDNRDEVIAAAKAEGLADAITVNTSTLKAWLAERAKETGSRLEDAATGTKFDGLVSSYVKVRLRGRTVA